jgi:hypothetical protein
MKMPSPLPYPLNRRPFTLDESDAAGVSRGRTKARDLRGPSRGIRVPTVPGIQLLDRCRPYAKVTGSGVISHVTAARIHGLYLPRQLEERPAIDLARPFGCPGPRRKHVIGHRLRFAEGDVVVVGDVPVTSITRTWLDLATMLNLDDLVVIGDQIVCEHHRNFGPPKEPMIPMTELLDDVLSRRRLMGIAKVREALALVRVGADSPPETRLRLMLQRAGLPQFVPDLPIRNARGEPDVWPDLNCEDHRTCVEYEGQHHLTLDHQASDHDRDYRTRQLGWHQAKINDADMKAGVERVVRKVARELVAGGWSDPLNLAGGS